MAFQIKRDIVFQTILCSLVSISMTLIQGTESDILCLKSIKNSLEDPNNYLGSSWNFNNDTEGFICRFNGVDCWHPDENRVLNLKLSSMGLKGQFPRGLQNCASMTGLDLSNNNLSGPIPSNISTILQFVTNIDLSSNKFTGEIPTALANCTFLNVLNLDNNMLSGQIPPQLGLLTRLKSISFANNHLSGPVPVFNNSVDTNFANNSGLCGGYSLGPCSKGPGNDKFHFHPSFKGGLIIGYVLSFTCSVILTCMFYSNSCLPCLQLSKKKRKKNNHQNRVKQLCKYICSISSRRSRMTVNQLQELLHSQLIEKESIEISILLKRLSSTIWFEELSDATDGFAIDNAIGVGKTGMMYQGRLPNGKLLAVKRLFDSHLFKRQFLLETLILGKYRHKNIVPLLGFCIEGKERLLAYENMSNGRLSKWLNPLVSEVMRLGWSERAKIALGIARGLSWLHHSCDLGVVHLNICSQCILLDENFEPKISNFGEAKFMNLNNIEGDLVGKIFEVSDGKKDVYDFGSVLFELITGRTYNELSCSSSTTDMCGNPSNFYNVIDKSLTEDGFENEVCALLKIACECVQPLPDQRPTMFEVYNNISNVRKRHGSRGDSQSHTPEGSEIAFSIGMHEIVEL